MDPLQISLRILHVVFGTFWAGTTFFLVLIMEPGLRSLGPSIERPTMRALGRVISPAFMVSSVIVVGTGVALTLILRWGGLDTIFMTGWGWAMVVGLVATAAAIVVGFGFSARVIIRMEKLGRSIEGRPPNPDEARELQELSTRLETLSRINFALILIAVGAMAAARYL